MSTRITTDERRELRKVVFNHEIKHGKRLPWSETREWFKRKYNRRITEGDVSYSLLNKHKHLDSPELVKALEEAVEKRARVIAQAREESEEHFQLMIDAKVPELRWSSMSSDRDSDEESRSEVETPPSSPPPAIAPKDISGDTLPLRTIISPPRIRWRDLNDAPNLRQASEALGLIISWYCEHWAPTPVFERCDIDIGILDELHCDMIEKLDQEREKGRKLAGLDFGPSSLSQEDKVREAEAVFKHWSETGDDELNGFLGLPLIASITSVVDELEMERVYKDFSKESDEEE